MSTFAERVIFELRKRGLYFFALRTCSRHELRLEAVLGDDAVDRYDRRLSAARHEIWHVVHHSMALGLTELVRIFGRDRKSIYYGIRAHGARIEGIPIKAA